LQHLGPVTPSKQYAAHSSVDPVLTAFAQLGALRLNAQRALISLFGRHEQHVLTEATRTLSLQDDGDHNSHDELWVGSCTMSYERSLCKAVMNSTPNVTAASDRVFVVPDLTLDDTFKDHLDVVEFPNLRFLASSPIISPKGIVIGAYTILDDKPHDPLEISLQRFLVDISITVMNYLDTTRSQGQHLRSERMIVGLGSFLEGKGSLRNSWLVDSDNCQTTLTYNNHAEGRVNLNQQQMQVSQSIADTMLQPPTTGHMPFRPYNLHIPRSKLPQASCARDDLSDGTKTSRPHAKAQTRLKRAPQAAIANGKGRLGQQSPKDGYTAKIQDTFSRASNLIRESIEVEAVVFFSANFRSQESLVNNAKSDTEGSSSETCSSGEDDSTSRGLQQTDPFYDELAQNGGKSTLNPCEILGFATSNTSSINHQVTEDNKIALSESFLAGLLHRYPRGKIFNFGVDGAISSDDTSDGVFDRFFRRTGCKRYKRTRKTLLRTDAQTLLQLAPESRSIVFTPMWDSHKDRWYAGSLTWTRAAHRVFTSADELAFLLTFGNSVMAEVHRLGAHFAERAKSDLLAGLSHELRSPLHGIFGTAELLNDTIIDALQRGFIHTISSCAFTLLGSINQLLEYASINDIRPSSVVNSPSGNIRDIPGEQITSACRSSYPGKVDPDTYVELDSVVEEAVETVFAGYSFLGNSRSPLRGVSGTSSSNHKSFDTQGGVKVILDIDCAKSWKFSTRPGAWHVILTNIFGNALKFTQKGHIRISMQATPAQYGADGKVVSSKITVTTQDTGCGMDPEYLKNGLFTAFSQEDSMTIGNGLGFNITRRILESLGGCIQVNSQKNVGTEVIATVILGHTFDHEALGHTPGQFSIPNTKKLTRSKSVGILGLGTSDLDIALRTSLQNVCQNWLEMDVHIILPSQTQFTHCDFYISPHEHLDIGNSEIQAIAPDQNNQLTSPVILICSSPRVAHSMFAGARNRRDTDVHEFISQPCGPHKLAKTFEACIKRQQERMDYILSKAEPSDIPLNTSAPVGLSLSKRDSLVSPTSPIPESTGQPMVTITDRLAQMHSRPRSFSPKPGSPVHDVTRGPCAESINHFTTRSDQHVPGQDDPISNPGSNPPLMVLLVDDNDINIRLLIAFMKKLKCNYGIAQNGEEALQFFKSNFNKIGMVLMGRFSQLPLDIATI
jgi:signal transduction histidine kinase